MKSRTKLLLIVVPLLIIGLLFSACQRTQSDDVFGGNDTPNGEVDCPEGEDCTGYAGEDGGLETPPEDTGGDAVGQTDDEPEWVTGLQTSHENRVRELALVYYDQGIRAWLNEAGYTWDTLELAARQPEEETFESLNGDGHNIVVAGYQVQVTGLSFSYPAGMTTDNPVEGRCVKPSETNPSQVCTDVQDFSGTATLWVSLINWGQFAPGSGYFDNTTAVSQANTGGANACLTQADLLELGDLTQNGWIEDQGQIAGVQMTFTTDWTAPEGWIIQKNGVTVNSVEEGDTASVWSPANCRPLARE